MKLQNLSFWALLLMFHSSLHAQSSEVIPISIGILTESITHPGLKVGTAFELKDWQKTLEKKKGAIIKKRSFFWSPQVGFYTHTQNNTGLLLNIDFGIKRQKGDSAWLHSWAIGLGTLTQFNAGPTYEPNTNGQIEIKNGASRIYFNPSLSYCIQRALNDKLDLYFKPTLGLKIPHNTFLSALPLLELGIQYNLNLNSND